MLETARTDALDVYQNLAPACSDTVDGGNVAPPAYSDPSTPPSNEPAPQD